MKRLTSTLVLIFSLVALSACGFQLRGQALQLDKLPGPVQVSGIDRYSPLYREIARQLKSSGLRLADAGQKAGSRLLIQDYRSSSRVFSLNSSNAASEYELEESFRFSVRTPDDGERVAAQALRVLRIFSTSSDNVTVRKREEKQLREDMRRELVNRMIRRIRAQG